MEHKELIALIAEILEVDEVSEEQTLEEQGWDSLANLSFIAVIDERLGLEIDADELAEATTVAGLAALVSPAA